ncbi:MAG: hypothetical protein F2646_02805, partial [Actinobacteria bacterium]|nr:hypothetical protein [Actinomycetota bacterium]
MRRIVVSGPGNSEVTLLSGLSKSGALRKVAVAGVLVAAIAATVASGPESNNSGSGPSPSPTGTESSPAGSSTLVQTTVTWTGSGTVSAKVLPRPTSSTDPAQASIDLAPGANPGLLTATATPAVDGVPLQYEVRT